MTHFLMVSKAVFLANKNLYYQSLKAFDTQEELVPLKLFLKAALVKTRDHPRFLRHVHRR